MNRSNKHFEITKNNIFDNDSYYVTNKNNAISGVYLRQIFDEDVSCKLMWTIDEYINHLVNNLGIRRVSKDEALEISRNNLIAIKF